MDVIIWDEASMSSARMLELANALHHAVANKVTGDDKVPFGGKQMIIVGEFLQTEIFQLVLPSRKFARKRF